MLLTLWHPRRAFIKFLRLHVPHVLWCNANLMAGDFIGNRAGIFPLILLSNTNIVGTLHSLHFALIHFTCALTQFTCALTNIKSQSEESSYLRVSLFKPFHIFLLLLFFTQSPFSLQPS